MKQKYLLVLGLLASGGATAEQGCAPGFFPGGTQPNGPVCVPIPGYGTTNNTSAPQPSTPEVRWADRWGAIAIDDAARKGGIGTVVGMSNKRDAKQAALARCHEDGGGRGCEVKATFRNGCGVVAWGDAHYTTAVSVDIPGASELAMKSCGRKTSNCEVFYADCSHPERIW